MCTTSELSDLWLCSYFLVYVWNGPDQPATLSSKAQIFPITSTTLQRSSHFLHPTVAQSYRTSVSTWSLLFGHSLLRGRHTYRNMLMTILLCHVCVIPYSSLFFPSSKFYSFNVQMKSTTKPAHLQLQPFSSCKSGEDAACQRVQRKVSNSEAKLITTATTTLLRNSTWYMQYYRFLIF